MSRWHDDDKIITVQLMVICFSWENQVSVAPKDVYRPSIFFFPHPYPFALAVNKSPAVYFFSRALDGLWRENGGSVNRLFFIRCIACSTSSIRTFNFARLMPETVELVLWRHHTILSHTLPIFVLSLLRQISCSHFYLWCTQHYYDYSCFGLCLVWLS